MIGHAALTPLAESAERLARDALSLRAAAEQASVTRDRFATAAVLALDSGVTLRATLAGVHGSHGQSTGTLRWAGLARALLPSEQLRIADNEIAVRELRVGARWQPLGSASGIALDVGRELLMHPFLLDVTAVARGDRVLVVRSVARPADLRRYATNERHGLATELLAGARSLQIDALLVGGRLAGDRFQLVTVLPSQLATRLHATRVTLTGCTTRAAFRG
ncbi:MAG: hypothetical protein JWN41_822 [Thermoleophilia bacterium]|nr:hypothetical protein [Thermoleophilia bacterium]